MLFAYYFSTIGKPKEAVHLLIAAADLDPASTLDWMKVSDDFYRLKDDQNYLSFKKSLVRGLQEVSQ